MPASLDLAVRKYRIPPEKYYKNIDHYGNTAAASVPLVLSELYEQGRIGPGSRLLTVAFGRRPHMGRRGP